MKKAAIPFVILLFDLILKYFAQNNSWRIHENYGLAFNIPAPDFLKILFSLIIILVCLYYSYYFARNNQTRSIALLFIACGGVGNLFDRIVYGFVVDYIFIFTSAFNLSDLLVLFGVLILLFERKKS